MQREKARRAMPVMVREDFEIRHGAEEDPLRYELHSHDFYEVMLFVSGSMGYFIEGKSYRLRPGDVLLVSNRELHRPELRPGQPYERYVAWINSDFLASLPPAEEGAGNCFTLAQQRGYNLLRPGKELLASILCAFERLAKQASPIYGSRTLRACYLTELLAYLYFGFCGENEDLAPDVLHDARISSVVRYVNEHLSEPLSLDGVAERFFVSKYHLCREFRRQMGFSLHQYIIKKRLIAAKLLLLQGSTATEAFQASGFGDYSHFSRAFKEEYGISPRDYRRAQG